MPRRNIWIRKQDLPKWESIENKSEWVHDQLDWVTDMEDLAPNYAILSVVNIPDDEFTSGKLGALIDEHGTPSRIIVNEYQMSVLGGAAGKLDFFRGIPICLGEHNNE